MRRFFVEKKRATANNKGALISLRGRAGLSAPLLFAHILRRVFSATLAIDQAQVALLLYGQLFSSVLIRTHWNIGSTFVRGWIWTWKVVKVTFSKTVRGNEEWQTEPVIKNCITFMSVPLFCYMHFIWAFIWLQKKHNAELKLYFKTITASASNLNTTLNIPIELMESNLRLDLS